jgi:hypothetical protein
MTTARIILLALLAGIGVAGCVWYFWGLVENLFVMRKQRALAAEAALLAAELADQDEDDGDV